MNLPNSLNPELQIGLVLDRLMLCVNNLTVCRFRFVATVWSMPKPLFKKTARSRAGYAGI